MEFRKIQFTGRSSYIISLPKRWVTENGLKRGDTVPIVVNQDGTITIFPKTPKRTGGKETIRISKKFSEDMAVRLAISAYIRGYDTIEIRFEDGMPSYKVKVRKTLQGLPGVEIILDEPQRIIAKSLLDEEDVDIKEVLERIESIVLSMIGDLELLMNAKGREIRGILRDISDLENELDRFYFLIIRIVNMLLSMNVHYERSGIVQKTFDLVGVLFIVRNIERIGDHLMRIAGEHEQLPNGCITASDLRFLRDKFSEMMNQVKNQDLSRIDELMTELKTRIKEEKKDPGGESHIRESYRRTLEYLENIGETIINMAVK